METEGDAFYLMAVPKKDRLLRILKYMLDEKEFFSPYGIRSLSKVRFIHSANACTYIKCA